MLDYLLELDKEILFFLNGAHNAFWDNFMFLISQKAIWFVFYLAIVISIFRKFGWRQGLFVLLSIALVVLICDQTASGILKPLFKRFRPSRDPQISYLVNIVKGYTGGKYGFASSHAANTVGLATFLSYVLKNRSTTFFIVFWAILVSYSRIYLGVHYLGDILVGSIIGILAGYFIYKMYCKFSGYRFSSPSLYKENFITKHFIAVIGISQIALLLLASKYL